MKIVALAGLQEQQESHDPNKKNGLCLRRVNSAN